MSTKEPKWFEMNFHKAPLGAPETIDREFIDRNFVPAVAIRSFRIEPPQPKPPIRHETLPLKILSGFGIDARYANLNTPRAPLTEHNFDQLPKEADKKEDKPTEDLLDPAFFVANGLMQATEHVFYKDVAEIAWSKIMGTGFIQTTSLAHERYGIIPRSVNGALPKSGRKLERRTPYLPNINFIITTSEEAEPLSRLYKTIGAKHVYAPEAEQTWYSAHEDDNIYIILYLNTDKEVSDEEQRVFLDRVIGKALTPEREERIRADSGYPGMLAYALLTLAIEALYKNLEHYKDNQEATILKDRHSHFNVAEANAFTIQHTAYLIATGLMTILGQRSDQ